MLQELIRLCVKRLNALGNSDDELENRALIAVMLKQYYSMKNDLNMTYFKDILIDEYKWEEKSFTNGCAKLDINGNTKEIKPISNNFI